jgi:hypothetical protein
MQIPFNALRHRAENQSSTKRQRLRNRDMRSSGTPLYAAESIVGHDCQDEQNMNRLPCPSLANRFNEILTRSPWPTTRCVVVAVHQMVCRVPRPFDIARIVTGVTYTRTTTSRPSDSFPGLMASGTGGTPKTVGGFYDVAYDRVLAGPTIDIGNGLPGTGPGGCTVPGGTRHFVALLPVEREQFSHCLLERATGAAVLLS